MRSRKIFTIALSTIFIFNFGIAQAGTNPKAGASCDKPGQVKSYKSKKFTCVVKNKKFVWNAGVKNNQSTQTKPITPELPSFVAPTNRPKTIADLDPKTAWYFAWESMEEFRKQNSSYRATYNIVMGANFKADVKEVIVEGLDAGSTFWSNFWKPDTPMKVMLGTEKDMDFWRAHLSTSELEFLTDTYARFGANTNSAGANWFGKAPKMSFNYGTNLTAATVRQNNWQTGPHEYTHIVQGTMGPDFGLFGMGCIWMIEGQAEQTGIFLTVKSPTEYLNYRNVRLKTSWGANSDQVNIKSADQIYNSLTDTLQRQPGNAIYSYGAAAWEALVALYGHQKVLDYFTTIKSGTWWVYAFETHFGMKHDDFLRQISPYLAELRKELVP